MPCPVIRSMDVSKTLPRRSTRKSKHFFNKVNCSDFKEISVFGEKRNDFLLPPLQNAPRPATLPTRGTAIKVSRESDINSIRTTETHLSPINKASNTTKANKINTESVSPCESPSYVTHTSIYKFPPDANIEMPTDLNPLPVPPKEGKKHIPTNAKRHVRKYPLIIPANGVQRTLNKIMSNETASMSTIIKNEQDAISATTTTPTTKAVTQYSAKNYNNSNIYHCNDTDMADESKVQLESEKTYQNVKTSDNTFSSIVDNASLQFESILEADFNKGHVLHTPDVADGSNFYNFSIQKEHYHKSKEFDYDHNKLNGLYVNEDELRNLDIGRNLEKVKSSVNNNDNKNNRKEIEDTTIVLACDPKYMHESERGKKKTKKVQAEGNDIKGDYIKMHANESRVFAKRLLTTIKPSSVERKSFKKSCEPNEKSELAGHALFKKVRESADKASLKMVPTTQSSDKKLSDNEFFTSTCRRLDASNSVSCEDLLEFANKKPKGRERGVDSDEVRIMIKVLGQNVTSERCLTALEFVEWDVHKAIKIIKLQNILNPLKLTVGHCAESLEQYEWDLHTTTTTFKTTNT